MYAGSLGGSNEAPATASSIAITWSTTEPGTETEKIQSVVPKFGLKADSTRGLSEYAEVSDEGYKNSQAANRQHRLAQPNAQLSKRCCACHCHTALQKASGNKEQAPGSLSSAANLSAKELVPFRNDEEAVWQSAASLSTPTEICNIRLDTPSKPPRQLSVSQQGAILDQDHSLNPNRKRQPSIERGFDDLLERKPQIVNRRMSRNGNHLIPISNDPGHIFGTPKRTDVEYGEDQASRLPSANDFPNPTEWQGLLRDTGMSEAVDDGLFCDRGRGLLDNCGKWTPFSPTEGRPAVHFRLPRQEDTDLWGDAISLRPDFQVGEDDMPERVNRSLSMEPAEDGSIPTLDAASQIDHPGDLNTATKPPSSLSCPVTDNAGIILDDEGVQLVSPSYSWMHRGIHKNPIIEVEACAGDLSTRRRSLRCEEASFMQTATNVAP